MTSFATTTIKAATAALLLLALSACTGTAPGGPDMVDYSYVPSTTSNVTVSTAPGIESF